MEASPVLTEALKMLWLKFLPQIRERVAVIDDANRALRAGSLPPDQRAAAAAAAHKLAGTLGTFGLAEGTNLAREAEELYSSEAPLNQDTLARLEAIAQQLSSAIQVHS